MKAILEIDLLFPYGKSIEPLLQLINIWKCDIVRVGTRRRTQVIAMPWKSFKQIWGRNPVKGQVEVPKGTEDFVNGVRVVRVEG